MIAINEDSTFADGWDVERQPKASTAFWRALLDAMSEGWYFYDATGETLPDEIFQEAIEAGVAELARVLNEE